MTFFAVCFIIFALYKTCLKDRQDRNQLTININIYINQHIHMASPNIMAHGGDGVPVEEPQVVLDDLQETISSQLVTIEEQRQLISQYETNLAELNSNILSQEEKLQRQSQTLEQYKTSDEKNLKAIESLEAKIWESTDANNQLLTSIGENEAKYQDIFVKYNFLNTENENIKLQIVELNDKLKSKTADMEWLQSTIAQSQHVDVHGQVAQSAPVQAKMARGFLGYFKHLQVI